MRSNRPPSTISGLSGGGVMGMRGNNKEVEIEVPWTNMRGRESADDGVSVNSEQAARFGPGNVDGN